MTILATSALTTVGNVEESLNVTLTATQRDVVTRMINGMTAAAHKYTGRKLKAADYTPAANAEDALFDGDGRIKLYLPQYPLQSITELEVGLIKFREIIRRAITAVTATTLQSGDSFILDALDGKMSRSVVSVSPTDSTAKTEAIITSVAGGVAALLGSGWSNGTPAVTSSWWFASGFYADKSKGILTFSQNVFDKALQNVRVTYRAGYKTGSEELDQLAELITSLVAFTFRKASKTGFASEQIGSYMYRLDSSKFSEFWSISNLAVLDQFVDWRKFL